MNLELFDLLLVHKIQALGFHVFLLLVSFQDLVYMKKGWLVKQGPSDQVKLPFTEKKTIVYYVWE